MMRLLRACAVFLATGELPQDRHGVGHSIRVQALKRHGISQRARAAVDPSAAGVGFGSCRADRVRERLWQWWDAEMLDCQHTPEEWGELFTTFLALAERETVDGWELNVQGGE